MSQAAIGELGRRDTLRVIAGLMGGAAGVRNSHEDDDETLIAGIVGPGARVLQLAPGFKAHIAPTVADASPDTFPSLVFGTDTGNWELRTITDALPFMAQSNNGLEVAVVQDPTNYTPDRYPALVFGENGMAELITE